MSRVDETTEPIVDSGANSIGMGSSAPDEAADEREAEAFEAYLEGAGEGPEDFADLRRVLAVMGEMEPIAAPDDFYDQVSRKLRRRRLLSGEAAAASLVSMPFQVVSVLAILIVAALYLLAEIDRDHRPFERAEPVTGDTTESASRGDS